MQSDNHRNGSPTLSPEDDVTRRSQMTEMSRANTVGSMNPLNIIDTYGSMDEIDRKNTVNTVSTDTDDTIALPIATEKTPVDIDITTLHTRLNQLISRPNPGSDNNAKAATYPAPSTSYQQLDQQEANRIRNLPAEYRQIGSQSDAAVQQMQQIPNRGLHHSPELLKATIPRDQAKQDTIVRPQETSTYIPPRIAGQSSRDEPKSAPFVQSTVQISGPVPIPPPPRQFYQPGVTPLKEEPKAETRPQDPVISTRKPVVPQNLKPSEPISQNNSTNNLSSLPMEQGSTSYKLAQSLANSANSTPMSTPAAREATLVPNLPPIPEFPKRNKQTPQELPQLNIPKPQAKNPGEIDINDMSSTNFLLRPLRKVSERMRRKVSKKGLGGSGLQYQIDERFTSFDSDSPESFDRNKHREDLDKIMIHMPPKAQSTDTSTTKYEDELELQDKNEKERKSQEKGRRPKKDRRRKQSLRKRVFGSVTPFTVLLILILAVNIFLVDTMLVFILVKVLPDISTLQNNISEAQKTVENVRNKLSSLPNLKSTGKASIPDSMVE